MFIDEAEFEVHSGRGGHGAVHFRREKYVPRGGPDGGDGGKGGNIILRVNPKLNTLANFRRQRIFKAQDGVNGGGSDKTGAQGEDTIILVPPGTLIYDAETDSLIGDLIEAGQELVICKGGRGGRGNARYATSRNQAPRMAERGEPGEDRRLRIELRLVADIGLVGVPNAGKSTLLAAVTNANPKIAAYPFTTLEPNLGVAELDREIQVVLADIPGLIEGAHMGVGLGFTFLRHIQRTRVLIHLIDASAPEPLADFSQVNTELALFDDELERKPKIVAVNKMDQPEAQEAWPGLKEKLEAEGYKPFAISALARQGLRELLWAAYHALQDVPVEVKDSEIPVYRPEEDPQAFEIMRDPDGAWRVVSKAVERAAVMTYWEYDEAVRRFQRILEHLGVDKELRERGAKVGDTVRIGEFELEWED
jgi:GTPase